MDGERDTRGDFEAGWVCQREHGREGDPDQRRGLGRAVSKASGQHEGHGGQEVE